jgi:FtsP/CotA-like multicopper oxidase with cupredoxin domain
VAVDPTTPPQFLRLPALAPLPAPVRTRPLALLEMMSMTDPTVERGPAAAMLGVVDENGVAMHQMWEDAVTENPMAGDTEVWEFYNFTVDAHPMHVHEVVFEVVERQKLVVDAEGAAVQPAQFDGPARPREAWESGYKDTVIAYPGEVTRIRAQFKKNGQYVWHCHIVEHEDNEMMRPYRIGPIQTGQPT